MINVLFELKKINLYHMDIKPGNILLKKELINSLKDAIEISELL